MIGTRKGNAVSPGSPENIPGGFHNDGVGSHPDWKESGKREEVNDTA